MGFLVLVVVLLFFFAVVFGEDLVEALRQRSNGLSRKQAQRLQDDYDAALKLLLSIEAYDEYSPAPLPTKLHDDLQAFLQSRQGRLPYRIDGQG
jgi:hypothetical protein